MPVLDAVFIQELQMQKEPKWHQEGRSNTRQHWAKAKVRNIARSFLWGSILTYECPVVGVADNAVI